MLATEAPAPTPSNPSPFAYTLSFLLVGLCWGCTTPFIRRAAIHYTAPTHPSITDPKRSRLSRLIAKVFFTVIGLAKKPAYAIPLVCNLTGSIWFFLLVGQAGTFFSLIPTCAIGKGLVGEGSCYVGLRCTDSVLCRTKLDGANHKFTCVLVHCTGRVSSRRKADYERHVAWDESCVWWDCALCY